jgi:hypothetical protein
MKIKPIFLTFILQSKNHIINYVSKYTYNRYKTYITYSDIKKDTILIYHQLNITCPIDSNEIKIKNMFKYVNKIARNEKKKSFEKRLQDYEPFEYMHIENNYELPIFLNDKEKRICNYIQNGTSIYDILFYEKISFNQFTKIKSKLRQKLYPLHNNYTMYNNIQSEFILWIKSY